jgi:hypothetical protein
VVVRLREQIFGPRTTTPVRIVTFLALISLGWQFARDAGRRSGRRCSGAWIPAPRARSGFLLRLGDDARGGADRAADRRPRPRTPALGGAFTAVVVGLAAQQTLGNLFAGMVLLSARRSASASAVRAAGRRASPGRSRASSAASAALHDARQRRRRDHGARTPVVLNVAIVPLREPDGIDLRARLRPG